MEHNFTIKLVITIKMVDLKIISFIQDLPDIYIYIFTCLAGEGDHALTTVYGRELGLSLLNYGT